VSFDESHYALKVAKHLRRRNAHRQNSMGRQPNVASGIAEGAITAFMRLSIHLHAQLRSIAVEVQRVHARRMLLAPVEARLLPPQLLLEQHLGEAHRAPQFSRAAVGLSSAFEHVTRSIPRLRRDPSTMLRMVPLPQQAGGGFWSLR
jgi:hypothetical protein